MEESKYSVVEQFYNSYKSFVSDLIAQMIVPEDSVWPSENEARRRLIFGEFKVNDDYVTRKMKEVLHSPRSAHLQNQLSSETNHKLYQRKLELDLDFFKAENQRAKFEEVLNESVNSLSFTRGFRLGFSVQGVSHKLLDFVCSTYEEAFIELRSFLLEDSNDDQQGYNDNELASQIDYHLTFLKDERDSRDERIFSDKDYQKLIQLLTAFYSTNNPIELDFKIDDSRIKKGKIREILKAFNTYFKGCKVKRPLRELGQLLIDYFPSHHSSKTSDIEKTTRANFSEWSRKMKFD